jgi:hypothetical protein
VPTRKQRRRRAKERRHEYEYVYVDEEGRELEVEPDEAKASERKDKRPAPSRGGRVVEPPSWNKVGKRALIFGPLMFITIRLLERGEPITASLFRTIFLLLIFLPFSYVMDAVLYRTYQRRMGGAKKS